MSYWWCGGYLALVLAGVAALWAAYAQRPLLGAWLVLCLEALVRRVRVAAHRQQVDVAVTDPWYLRNILAVINENRSEKSVGSSIWHETIWLYCFRNKNNNKKKNKNKIICLHPLQEFRECDNITINSHEETTKLVIFFLLNLSGYRTNICPVRELCEPSPHLALFA